MKEIEKRIKKEILNDLMLIKTKIDALNKYQRYQDEDMRQAFWDITEAIINTKASIGNDK